MGCDIHLVLEIKIGGVWKFGGILDMDRHYQIFGRMASCGRSIDTEPIAENRGLPSDADPLTKIIAENSFDHSSSWLCSSEVSLLTQEWPVLNTWGESGLGAKCPFGGDWDDWQKTNYYGFTDFRWVFGFDN